MIYTVTLNPAIDQTIVIDNFSINQVNRTVEVREDIGGKGINVSKMIRNLQGESIAMGILGGNKGVFIEEQLKKMGIPTSFIKTDSNTRTNIKIVDKIKNTFTDINESGAPVPRRTIRALEEQLFHTLTDDDLMILAGSVPSNVEKDIYAKWIRLGKQKKIKTLLDAEGDLLKAGVQEGPYLIKPNIHELEGLFGQRINSVRECMELSKQLFNYGIEIIVVSMGEEGCLLMTRDRALRAKGLKVAVKSTVGAGDSMVAALAHVLGSGGSLEEALILGVAASSASIQHEGTIMGSWKEVQQLGQRVQLEYVSKTNS